jgi:hypothetical protein
MTSLDDAGDKLQRPQQRTVLSFYCKHITNLVVVIGGESYSVKLENLLYIQRVALLQTVGVNHVKAFDDLWMVLL